MSENHIGNKGAERISEALKQNTTLTELDISSNYITDKGGYKISDAVLSNSTLNLLLLNRNSLSDKCMNFITKCWIKPESRLPNNCIL